MLSFNGTRSAVLATGRLVTDSAPQGVIAIMYEPSMADSVRLVAAAACPQPHSPLHFVCRQLAKAG